MIMISWTAQNGILSESQWEIFEKGSNGWTYAQIISHFNLSGDHALISCLVRTSQGKYWYSGYLDKLYFKYLLENCANEINCVPTTVSTQLVF